MPKTRTTADGVVRRLIIIAALVGSYCRAARSITVDGRQMAAATNFRPSDFRRDEGNVVNDATATGDKDNDDENRLFPAVANWSVPADDDRRAADDDDRTSVQKSLHRASDTVSKFLPFVVSADSRTRCFKHTAVYLTQLNDFTLWATKSEEQPHLLYHVHY